MRIEATSAPQRSKTVASSSLESLSSSTTRISSCRRARIFISELCENDAIDRWLMSLSLPGAAAGRRIVIRVPRSRPSPCLDLLVVLLDEMPRNRQTKAEPAMLAGRATVGLPEAIEDERQEFGVDADPGVCHLDRHHVPAGRAANLDATALGRELDRIRHDIAEDLLQAFGIAVNRRQVSATQCVI